MEIKIKSILIIFLFLIILLRSPAFSFGEDFSNGKKVDGYFITGKNVQIDHIEDKLVVSLINGNIKTEKGNTIIIKGDKLVKIEFGKKFEGEEKSDVFTINTTNKIRISADFQGEKIIFNSSENSLSVKEFFLKNITSNTEIAFNEKREVDFLGTHNLEIIGKANFTEDSFIFLGMNMPSIRVFKEKNLIFENGKIILPKGSHLIIGYDEWNLDMEIVANEDTEIWPEKIDFQDMCIIKSENLNVFFKNKNYVQKGKVAYGKNKKFKIIEGELEYQKVKVKSKNTYFFEDQSSLVKFENGKSLIETKGKLQKKDLRKIGGEKNNAIFIDKKKREINTDSSFTGSLNVNGVKVVLDKGDIKKQSIKKEKEIAKKIKKPKNKNEVECENFCKGYGYNVWFLEKNECPPDRDGMALKRGKVLQKRIKFLFISIPFGEITCCCYGGETKKTEKETQISMKINSPKFTAEIDETGTATYKKIDTETGKEYTTKVLRPTYVDSSDYKNIIKFFHQRVRKYLPEDISTPSKKDVLFTDLWGKIWGEKFGGFAGEKEIMISQTKNPFQKKVGIVHESAHIIYSKMPKEKKEQWKKDFERYMKDNSLTKDEQIVRKRIQIELDKPIYKTLNFLRIDSKEDEAFAIITEGIYLNVACKDDPKHEFTLYGEKVKRYVFPDYILKHFEGVIASKEDIQLARA